MIVISNNLTTGEISFILRITIQILSFGGLFLIGLVIFGSAAKVAPLETHDILNRVAGQSTATTNTLKWIAKRVFRRSRDPTSSSALAFALALSLCYGLFVSLSDVGLIGIHSCTISGSSFQDFPASINSDSDALAVVSANMVEGADPHTVKSYRCDSSYVGLLSIDNHTLSGTLCTSWYNSTYGDPSNFHALNSTDSDILMLRNLGSLYDNPDVDTWLMGLSGQAVLNPTIVQGLAVIPHETGVSMIVGVPDLSKEQQVDIPKTLALELEIGCMPLGIFGERSMDPRSDIYTEDIKLRGAADADFFVPDEIYLSERIGQYAGSDIIRDPLMKVADAIRNTMLPWFNSSAIDANGNYVHYYSSYGSFTAQSIISGWSPPFFATDSYSLLLNCTAQIQMLNVSSNIPSPRQGASSLPCSFYQLSGSFLRNQTAFQKYAAMVCATATQANMVSATLAIDKYGGFNSYVTRLPSDLNTVQATKVFSILPQMAPLDGLLATRTANESVPASSVYEGPDYTRRFTLSDNPAGDLQHYIYQEDLDDIEPLQCGLASSGQIFTTAGCVSLLYLGSSDVGLINSSYFSVNFNASQLTSWGGGVAASYILQSAGYNGWAARGSQGFTVVSTGGQVATCYDSRYGVALVPLLLAVLIVTSWAVVILFTSGIREAQRLQDMYGGLSPAIDLPFPGKLPGYTFLTWDNDPEPHLKPAVEKMPVADYDAESEALVSNAESDETFLGMPSDSAEPPSVWHGLENVIQS